MKKIVFASILLAFALSACAGKNSEKKSEEINQQKEVKKMGTIHLTKAEFLSKVANYEANPTEWKYLGDKPCIIDFYASWCGPCKMIAPILDELAADYAGKVSIVKVNVDENQESPAKFGIRGIPTLLLFKNGTLMGTKVGAASKSQLAAFIDSHI